MLKLVLVLTIFLGASATYSADVSNPLLAIPIIGTENAVISYTGPLSKEGTGKVLPLIESNQFKTLRINSRGGDVMAAIEFASAVFDHGLDVEVTELCNSSCANYIFPAGRRKTISLGAFVMWHGDARQKDFMAVLQQLETVERAVGYAAMTNDQRNRLDFERSSIAAQDALYAKLGIDGRIARFGQEIDPPIAFWAMPKDAMAAFGIVNVSAPDTYGSAEYCQLWLKKHYENPKATCISPSTEFIEKWRVMKH
jgi:hypothetical protein